MNQFSDGLTMMLLKELNLQTCLDFVPEFKLKAAIQLENIGGTDTLITANAETRDTPLKMYCLSFN